MSGPAPMVAIATLLNLLLLAEDELLTFWNNDSGDLVLIQKKGPKKPQDLIWTKTAKQTGIVKNPSSIIKVFYGISSSQSPVLERLNPTVDPLKHNIPITQVASLASIMAEYFSLLRAGMLLECLNLHISSPIYPQTHPIGPTPFDSTRSAAAWSSLSFTGA